MIKIDQHFHTTLSDGVNSSAELLERVKKNQYYILVATEHDIINRDFSKGMIDQGFPQVEGVEISVKDRQKEIKQYTGKNSFHMTYYKDRISDAIEEMLQNTCGGKQEKIKAQMDKLQAYGFNISQEKFYTYRETQFPGKDRSGYNVLHLSQYIFLSEENKKLVQEIFGKDVSYLEFLKECLLSSGKHAHIGTQQVYEYEPDLEKLANTIHEGVLTIAHPNYTFKSREGFQKAAEFLIKKYPISAIEINARADKQRVEAIVDFCKVHSLIITFGSDFHAGAGDETHGAFGETNRFISAEMSKENYENFLQKI